MTTPYFCDNCGTPVDSGYVVHDPGLDEQESDIFYCGPCYRVIHPHGVDAPLSVRLLSDEPDAEE
jgi:hypothetical protein